MTGPRATLAPTRRGSPHLTDDQVRRSVPNPRPRRPRGRPTRSAGRTPYPQPAAPCEPETDMTIVVGYIPRPEGLAAVDAAIAEAELPRRAPRRRQHRAPRRLHRPQLRLVPGPRRARRAAHRPRHRPRDPPADPRAGTGGRAARRRGGGRGQPHRHRAAPAQPARQAHHRLDRPAGAPRRRVRRAGRQGARDLTSDGPAGGEVRHAASRVVNGPAETRARARCVLVSLSVAASAFPRRSNTNAPQGDWSSHPRSVRRVPAACYTQKELPPIWHRAP